MTRLFDGTIWGGCNALHGVLQAIKNQVFFFSAHSQWLKGYLRLTDLNKNQSVGVA